MTVPPVDNKAQRLATMHDAEDKDRKHMVGMESSLKSYIFRLHHHNVSCCFLLCLRGEAIGSAVGKGKILCANHFLVENMKALKTLTCNYSKNVKRCTSIAHSEMNLVAKALFAYMAV